MKTLLVTILIVSLFSVSSWGQSALNTSGGDVANPNGSVAYSLGSMFGSGASVSGSYLAGPQIPVAFYAGNAPLGNYPTPPGSGDALAFDGVNDHVIVPDSPSLNPTGGITVECWYKPPSFAGNGNNPIVDKAFTSHSPPFYQYHLGVTGDLYGGSGQATFNWSVSVGGTIYSAGTGNNYWVPGQWYHIAGVYDGTEVLLYVNGILVNSNPTSGGALDQFATDLFIAKWRNLGFATTPGDFDELRIWGAGLSESEIRDHMCQKDLSAHPQIANLAAYYRFDDSTGSGVLQDISGNGNNGTLTNMDPATDWVTSGAPIGDLSAQGYSAASVTLSDGTSLTADNLTGSPDGVHVYKVNEAPNDVTLPANYTGLETSEYYGVHVVGGNSPTYDATWDYTTNANIDGQPNEDEARLASRADNAAGAFSDVFLQALDETGNTLTLQNQSGTEYIAGFAPSPSYPTPPGSGDALAFDGIIGEVVVQDDESLDNTTSITLESWVKLSEFGGSDYFTANPIISKWDLAGTPNNSFILLEINGLLQFWVSDGVSSVFLSTPAHNMELNNWYHVSVTFDSGFVTFYLNGLQLGSTLPIGVGQIQNGPRPLIVGGWRQQVDPNFETFNGFQDEVRIWKSALSASEIRDHMCQKDLSAHPQIANLAAYYRFDDGAGSGVLQDISGNGNNGTLTNMDPATDWVTSGAPIGDLSAQGYGTASVTLADGTSLVADNLTGSPDGVHVYKVNEAPNDVTVPGTYTSLETSEYYGVHVVGGTTPTYSATFDYGANGNIEGQPNEFAARLASRADNAAGAFADIATQTLNTTANTLVVNNQSGTEYIPGFALCTNPDVPTVSATQTAVCAGLSTTLSIDSGNLNDATDWQWYTGSCGGASAGSGTSLLVSPTATTTYFARGEGGCVTPGACAQITITVNPNATGTDVITACESYTWIDGNTYTSDNNTAQFNIVGGAINGCDSLVTLDLTIVSNTLAFTSSTTPATLGFANGAASVSVSGGTPPYSYQWDDAFMQTTADLLGVFPGTYNCVVTDAAGCEVIVVVEIDFESNVPVTQVNQLYCNTSGYVLSDFISAASVPSAEGYRWEFTPDGGAALPEYTRNTGNPWLRLQWVNGIQIGTTYGVRVKTKVNGEWGNYGLTCSITLSADVPLTQLRPEYQGTNAAGQPYAQCDLMIAEAVSGATNYRWRLDPDLNPENGNEIFYTRGAGNPGVRLSWIDGTAPLSTFNVAVEAAIGAEWSGFGNAYPVVLAPPATAELRSQYCGITYPSASGVILAQSVCAADNYEWEFDGPTLSTATTGNYALNIGAASVQPPLQPGVYNVRVKVTQEGIPGDFGPVCVITIGGPGAPGDAPSALRELAENSATLFPNPNAGDEVRMELDGLSDGNHEVMIQIYDSYGKLIQTEGFGHTGTNLSRVVRFNSELATGMYMMNITVDGERYATERLIVK